MPEELVLTLDELIDTAYELRERKYQAQAVVDAIDDEFKQLESEIIRRATDLNIKTAGTAVAKISVSEETVPNVTDWDQVFNHIRETGAFYLLKKQLNTGPYRELIAAGNSLVGVEPFVRRKLSLRKA